MIKEIREKFYIKDENDYPIFEVTVLQYKDGKYSDVSCEFKVRSIGAWEADDSKTPYEDEIEEYLNMTVKWDGCSHLYFGDEIEDGIYNSYHHFCGADSFKKHVRLLHTLYNKAYVYMGREPYDKSEEWNEL